MYGKQGIIYHSIEMTMYNYRAGIDSRKVLLYNTYMMKQKKDM